MAALALLAEAAARAAGPLPWAPRAIDLAAAGVAALAAALPAVALAVRWRTGRAWRAACGLPVLLAAANLALAAGAAPAVLWLLPLPAAALGVLLAGVRPAVLGLLAAVACVPVAARAGPWALRRADTAGPSLLLVVLDTTSAGHLSAYGYPRDTSPALAALAARGLRYERAISPAPWTVPAHAALFTGLLPSALGFDGARFSALDTAGSLARDLYASGRRTCAIAANPVLTGWRGLDAGFESFWAARRLTQPLPALVLARLRGDEGFTTPAAQITALALDWLDRLSRRGEPWALVLNYVDPHAPYHPPSAARRGFAPGIAPDVVAARTEAYNTGLAPLTPSARAAMRALYDAEVAAMDAAVGVLLDGLRARGWDERSVLVAVTADHGEALGEHGVVGHLLGMTDPILHVPLVLAGPGVPVGRVMAAPVQPTQLRATVRALLGQAADPRIAPALPPWGDAPALLVSEHPEPAWYFDDLGAVRPGFVVPPAWRGHWIALERRGTKVVFSPGDDSRGASYDLATDPGEQAPRPRAAAADLVAAWGDRSRLAPIAPSDAGRALPDAARDHLRALGYLR